MSDKHISRLDYAKTHGWWLRIRRKSNTCSKLFSDGVHGGSDGALKATIIWRDGQPVESAQYLSIRYTERLAEASIEPSVGSKGDSYDNALGSL